MTAEQDKTTSGQELWHVALDVPGGRDDQLLELLAEHGYTVRQAWSLDADKVGGSGASAAPLNGLYCIRCVRKGQIPKGPNPHDWGAVTIVGGEALCIRHVLYLAREEKW